jgi:hypothetical protein
MSHYWTAMVDTKLCTTFGLSFKTTTSWHMFWWAVQTERSLFTSLGWTRFVRSWSRLTLRSLE